MYPRTSHPVSAVPALIFATIVVIVPLLLLTRISFDLQDPRNLTAGVFDIANYLGIAGDSFYRRAIINTLIMATLTTLTCVVLAFPLSYVAARARSARIKALILIALFLPLLIGNVVRAIGWAAILADRGLLNGVLLWLGLTSEPIRILYTSTAVYIALVSVLLPYAVIVMQGSIEAISPALEDAAANLGAGTASILRRVLLPLAMPGIFAAATLCFILSMGAYATPVLVGGTGFPMLAPQVYEQIIKVSNWPLGSALAITLILVTALVVVASTVAVERRYGRV